MTRMLRAPILAILAATFLSGGAIAQSGTTATGGPTLDLKFRPPDISPGPICVSPPGDDATLGFWQAWDKRALPDRDMADIRRDIRRLLQIDGAMWFGTATRAMDLLEEQDSDFFGETALLLRILALDASGRFAELTDSGLVQNLADLGPDLGPQGKTVLAGYLRSGLGIAQDEDRADALLIEAGFAGSSSALQALARRQLDGTAPADWIVPVELTVTTAFGALVGELGPDICERTVRIAEQYQWGGIVTPDIELAHDWFRFSADLGDGHAAWKVAQMHLDAEGFDRANDVMLRYLQKAASADLSYAQIELARVHERGALAPRDMGHARALYEDAARGGSVRGLSQLALFLGRQPTLSPEDHTRRIEVLTRLTEIEEAPGWAFAALAEITLEDEGRWAGAAKARDLAEEAVLRDTLDGHVILARILLATGDGVEDVDRAVDLLTRVASERGGAQPMSMLQAAHACVAPDGPHLSEMAFWQARERALGTQVHDHDQTPVTALDHGTHPLRLAAIQSEAIEASPVGLAEWQRILNVAPFATDGQRRLWSGYHAETDDLFIARAKVDLSLTNDPKAVDLIHAGLRARYLAAGPDFAGGLTPTLFDGIAGPKVRQNLSAEEDTALANMLHASAALGYGRAMQVLAARAPTHEARQALFAQYRPIIDADGDFAAQVFAAGLAQDADRDRYLARAAGTVPCTYRTAMEMVDLARDLSDRAGTDRWLAVAQALVENDPSQMTGLARARLSIDGRSAMPAALSLLTRASLLGHTPADREIFRIVVTPGSDVYDPERAADLIVQAADDAAFDRLSGYLSTYRDADDAVRARIAAIIDMQGILRVAAESGDATSMRSYGRLLRDDAQDADELAHAMTWLHRAAEAGDSFAMADYGEALAFGIGVPADRAQAVRWLDRAASRGSDRAAEITRLIRLSGQL
ncbi:tetratricopeptide repeat protein [Jannaschia sp. 2305UL9-9]|uniref:tetratricopeptide repeat protein n=1 Tax=Jannaschia sp. 2305UL9-9 TaxID=3121638 RepID=UPI003528B8E7